MASVFIQLVTKSSQITRATPDKLMHSSRLLFYSRPSISHTRGFVSRSRSRSRSRIARLPSVASCFESGDGLNKTSSWRIRTPPLEPHHQLQCVRFASSGASKETLKPKEPVAIDDSSITQPPAILSQLNSLSPKPKESHEYIWTVPNILTFSRLALTPVIGYTILTSQPYIALGLFAYAGITDLVDGYIARRYNLQTVLGTVIDPMADKALMTTVVICTSIQGLLPVWLAVIILGRDLLLAISAIYFRYISLPPPKTFMRYWDFSLPSAEVHPTEISKINTMLQLLLIGNAMVLPALPGTLVDAWNLVGVFEGWQYLVATTTVWSGLSYIWSKDAVKILSVEEAKAKEAAMARAKNEGN